MKKRVRRTICTTLARGGYTKKSRSFEILGIGYDGFVKHIESELYEVLFDVSPAVKNAYTSLITIDDDDQKGRPAWNP